MVRETDQRLGGKAPVAPISSDFKGTSVVSSEVASCQQSK
jgi:hypothetical protein